MQLKLCFVGFLVLSLKHFAMLVFWLIFSDKKIQHRIEEKCTHLGFKYRPVLVGLKPFETIFEAKILMRTFPEPGDASSVEEFKLRIVQSILECSGDFPISSAEIQSLKQKEIPDGMNVKCLLACAYKKSGMMDNDGKLAVEGIKKMTDELFADRPDLIKKSEDFTEECKFVNNEELYGDKKDCERARMIYKCIIERANKFDITTS